MFIKLSKSLLLHSSTGLAKDCVSLYSENIASISMASESLSTFKNKEVLKVFCKLPKCSQKFLLSLKDQ